MDKEQTVRPVPAPRRLYPELRKSEYENVAVELINKNLNIKSENLQNNANNNEKVPNNKVFLLYPNLPENDDDITPTNNNNKSILTETNDLYGPNANENVAIYAAPTPKPAPRPRKPQNNEIQSYENTIIRPVSSGGGEGAQQQQQLNILDSTGGAINKINNESPIQVTRRAPELPPKTYLNSEREMERRRRYSISSEVSTTSSCHRDTTTDLKDINFKRDKLNKSTMSYKSSNSSLADSVESSENSKYKSPSPGDLLKSLGSTSKLLTESIGERVASKAKGAKHKLDKNLKSSTDALSSIGAGTTSRLKKLGANFTLTKKDKTATAEFHMDRPQTLPPNDQVFTGITFTSPLSNKAKGMYDLRQQQDEFDNSYEVPRSVRMLKTEEDKENEALQPPSYNEVMKTASTSSNENTPISSKRQIATNPLALEAASKVLNKRLQNNLSADDSDTNPFALEAANKVLLKRSQNSLSSSSSETLNSRDSMDQPPSPPMPSIPAPVLPPDFAKSNNNNTNEPAYGKINPVQPPVRHKRRKNYEDIQLRRELPESNINNLRPNIDSAELHAMNAAAVQAEREESLILREKLLEEEKKTPQPDRSDSWEYHEEQDNASTSSSNDVDPIYANQEVTYGNVFEMATSNKDILTPRNALVQISEEESADETDLGAVGGFTLVEPSKDIIQEFDPLMHKRGTTLKCNDKSNQLLLLEYLLEEDTYGSVNDQSCCAKSDDDLSMCTSEEDNTHMAAANEVPSGAVKVLPTPNLQEKQLEKPSTSAKPMQIVHQNAHLLSDSRENMLSDDFEARVKPYLSRVDENPTTSSNRVDLGKPSPKRSQWFVADDSEQQQKGKPQGNSSQTRPNPFNKPNIEDGESPPSYLEAIGECPSDKNVDSTQQKHSSQGTAARFMNNTKNVFSNVKSHVDALKRKASFKTQPKSADVKVTLQMIPRPSLSPLLVRYEGPLIRFPSGVVEDILKEMQNRKAILRDRQFQTFLDQEMKTPKEAIPLEYITTLQCVSNSRVTDNSTRFYCFEITTSIPKNGSGSSSSSNNVQQLSNPNLIITSGSSGNVKYQRACHLYGVGKESERGIWMQKLLESLTNVVPVKYTCQYYRAGWCYLKNSITSEWSGTWLVLKKTQRRLIFVTEATGNVEKVDLRKARCIVLKDSDETIKNLHVENGPMLMIDAPPFTVYMIMSTPRETKIWRHIIREVAHNNGFTLADQQLTKFNVPVIVDKCINFVYIHGSMSEGIYRKSGSENSILKLMSAFRADAFNVEITRNEYNEHDVANVLKRFMRDLPERLMGKLSESFICVSELKTSAEKIPLYKELLARLSVIERETLKKIVGHLAFISSQKAKNKMSIQNLTMIWGPTLMQNHQSQEEMVYSQKEADVFADLITLYKNLFPLSPDEMKKEQEMLLCLQKYYAAAESLSDSVKKSGDLKMWITLNPNPENTTEEKTQVNVTISPTKTAYEICQELAPKMHLSTHQVTLHEVICNGNLERPLHHDTKVFDVVLNWSYWPEDDRKNNVLVVKPLDFLNEVQRAVKNLATVTPGKELRFADNKTKSFKSYQCDLRDGKIVVSKKDKNDKTTIVREIFLHSTTAYLGCEKKRDVPWNWSITFVEKTQTQIMRSRDSPFIGHVLAGSEWVDRTIWYSSIWYCLHGDSILPPAEIIIK